MTLFLFTSYLEINANTVWEYPRGPLSGLRQPLLLILGVLYLPDPVLQGLQFFLRLLYPLPHLLDERLGILGIGEETYVVLVGVDLLLESDVLLYELVLLREHRS